MLCGRRLLCVACAVACHILHSLSYGPALRVHVALLHIAGPAAVPSMHQLLYWTFPCHHVLLYGCCTADPMYVQQHDASRLTPAVPLSISCTSQDYDPAQVESYNPEGHLQSTEPCGLHECGTGCTCTSPQSSSAAAASGAWAPVAESARQLEGALTGPTEECGVEGCRRSRQVRAGRACVCVVRCCFCTPNTTHICLLRDRIQLLLT